eukprot:gnl/TRDRNA2_/TRDRNA2_130802_c0_seq1.p1 gnl/TRDRNA2_/TRDRNA2_130802_c0~~gnl/TRDRNA2_/TRDRNA2_130802_c0_seq1.p1  ORF type:complete len:535 (+),score=75.38 gnl/TRDRNA2_/TRDRNA2_130802_c0_seq1:157-1761(+)
MLVLTLVTICLLDLEEAAVQSSNTPEYSNCKDDDGSDVFSLMQIWRKAGTNSSANERKIQTEHSVRRTGVATRAPILGTPMQVVPGLAPYSEVQALAVTSPGVGDHAFFCHTDMDGVLWCKNLFVDPTDHFRAVQPGAASRIALADASAKIALQWLDTEAGTALVCYKRLDRAGLTCKALRRTGTVVSAGGEEAELTVAAEVAQKDSEVVTALLKTGEAAVCYTDAVRHAKCRVVACKLQTCSIKPDAVVINPQVSADLAVTQLHENIMIACCRTSAADERHNNVICKTFSRHADDISLVHEPIQEGPPHTLLHRGGQKLSLSRMGRDKASVCFLQDSHHNDDDDPVPSTIAYDDKSRDVLCSVVHVDPRDGKTLWTDSREAPLEIKDIDESFYQPMPMSFLDDGVVAACAVPGAPGSVNHGRLSCGPLIHMDGTRAINPGLQLGIEKFSLLPVGVNWLGMKTKPKQFQLTPMSSKEGSMLLCYMDQRKFAFCHVITDWQSNIPAPPRCKYDQVWFFASVLCSNRWTAGGLSLL